ncbi:hypothetical protein LX36DRAFT_705635 [Colletotrichum falcatum]|nr:hypothetical protein LX36DRAFT_705635 [Colletotrichum falcatum]
MYLRPATLVRARLQPSWLPLGTLQPYPGRWPLVKLVVPFPKVQKYAPSARLAPPKPFADVQTAIMSPPSPSNTLYYYVEKKKKKATHHVVAHSTAGSKLRLLSPASPLSPVLDSTFLHCEMISGDASEIILDGRPCHTVSGRLLLVMQTSRNQGPRIASRVTQDHN